jgi:hypothetical protein
MWLEEPDSLALVSRTAAKVAGACHQRHQVFADRDGSLLVDEFVGD